MPWLNTNRPMEKPSSFQALKGIHLLVWLSLPLLWWSCEPEPLQTGVSVFTEEVVFSSGESAIMTGRILAQGNVDVSDHGFQIDTSAQFPSPIVVSLGERSVPGRFVGEVHELRVRQQYYCRAFMERNGEQVTGNVIPFSTVSPQVLDFSPKEGTGGTPVTITGVNLTADAHVLWNGKVIVPQEVVAEALLPFQAPPLTDQPVVTLRVVAQGDTLTLPEPFEYIIGKWTEVATLPDNDRNQRHVFFEDGDKFIYGLGIAMGHMSAAMQILDKQTLQLSTIFFPGNPTEGAFFSGGFFGGGSLFKVTSPQQSLQLSREFWRYGDETFTRLADIPASLYQAACIATDDKVYVYGGERADRSRNFLVWMYDIATDEWKALNPAPVTTLAGLPHFRLGNYHYVVSPEGQTWRHDPATDTWERRADYPAPTDVEYGVSLVLAGKAFAGMQGTSRKMLVYRPDSDSWRTKAGFLELNPSYTVGGWTSNDRIYVMRIQSFGGTTRTLWQLEPDSW